MREKLWTCTGTVTVAGNGWGRTFGPGALLDLDSRTPSAGGETWRELLGRHARLFVAVGEPVPEPVGE